MSIANSEEIKCPTCGYKDNVTIWQSLNTEINPEAKEDLLAGTLLRFVCPKCGANNDLCYPMLYHEMDKQIMIYHAPTPKDIEEAKKVFNSQRSLFKNDDKYICRIVTTPNDLREKAIIFENNLDDRVIEVLKLVYIQQAEEQFSDLQVEQALIYTNENKFYLQIMGNHPLTAEMELSNYNDIKNLVGDIIINNEDIIVDRKWALNTLEKINIMENDDDFSQMKNVTEAGSNTCALLKCDKCGHTLPNDSEFCQYCGSAIIKNIKKKHIEIKSSLDGPKIDKSKVVEDEIFVSQPSKARKFAPKIFSKKVNEDSFEDIYKLMVKGFLSIEDGKWRKADTYFDRVLELDIECGEAYVGKLLIDLHIKTKEALETSKLSFEKNINYQRALRFSDDTTRKWLRDILIKQRYNQAKNNIVKNNVKNLKKAAMLLKGIHSYKDSDELLSVCLKKIESLKRKNKNTLIIMLSALVGIIAVALLLVFFIIPNSKYNKAVSLREQGNYDEANVIFEGLGSFKDSSSLIHNHNYIVINETLATCTMKGSITYRCNECNQTYKEDTSSLGHNHSGASCTSADKCTRCGVNLGSALGHTTSKAICSRCGAVLFKKLTYSGNGPKLIKNINLPSGTYTVTLKHYGSTGNFIVKYYGSSSYYDLIANEIGYSHVVDTISSFSGVNNAFISVERAYGNWTIEIEAYK